MKRFAHHNAKTVDEAASLLGSYNGKSKINAGGTDLINVLKDDFLPAFPEAVINIKTIPGLAYITEEDGTLKIGALETLSDIGNSPVVKEKWSILAEAALSVATTQIRSNGTLAGNLCQDTRCWYYRASKSVGRVFNCLRKGGDTCYAVIGDNRYHSIFGGARVSSTPCAKYCPVHTDIPNYMAKVRGDDIDGAAEIILSVNPFPAITGRVCPHFCEMNCNMAEVDEAVSIKNVERFIGDHILENKGKFIKLPQNDTKKKIAIVGSGPAGLSAAYFLRKSGHTVTVFETMPFAGGTMAMTIPNYRLPNQVLEEEVEFIKDFGIEIKTDTPVGKTVTVPQLLEKEYDAVFVAIGAQEGLKLPVPGCDLQGTMTALDFLKDIKAGKKTDPGRKVVVIGGGSVAFDCARSAIRLGAEEVNLVCLESREAMPADPAEIAEGEAEGVKIHPALSTTGLTGAGGKVTGLECVGVQKMRFDEAGCLELETDCEAKSSFEADTVIFAIGQVPDISVLEGIEGLKFTRRHTVEIDPETLSTGVEGIYAGGDVSTTGGSVIEAIAFGKRAAMSINRYLGTGNGDDTNTGNNAALVECKSPDEGRPSRLVPPEMPVEERIKSMGTEVVKGIDRSAFAAEANRCLNCGCVAVNPSDTAVALTALDAVVVTNKRNIPVGEFYGALGPVLEGDEIVIEIQVPAPAEGTRQSWSKFRQRKELEFATVSVASVITAMDGNVSDARIVMGAVSPVPYRATGAEEVIKGKAVTEDLATAAGEAAVKDTFALSHNSYKIQIARTLVKRSILD